MQNRALIASNVSDAVRNFCEGYKALNYEAVAGRINFDLEIIDADVVHILWPEELVNWQTPPTEGEIDALQRRLDRWAKRSKLIFTVNNLYPHGHYGNPFFHRLYSAVFERADVIHHFGRMSKSMVCAEYPAIADRNHVVRVGFNYERLLAEDPPRDRNRARAALGFKDDELVFLTFGAIRTWEEAKCLMRGFDGANISTKRLLMCSRLDPGGSGLVSRVRRWYWDAWSRRSNITRMPGYVPESKLLDIFDAADAILTVRQSNLNSGIVSLAMTLGRPVVAPNGGTMAEFVAGTDNPIYNAESEQDLARAMERIATADREAIGAANARIASGWGWQAIISTCLEALPQ